jgi:hypothetical protein
MSARPLFGILFASLLAGCQGAGYDRIPATAADNPDPLMASRLPKVDTAAPPPAKSEVVATTPTGPEAPVTPTTQRSNDPNRIGPLTYRPTSTGTGPKQPADTYSPGPATLTMGVKEPKLENNADQNVRPASTFAPVSDPEVIKSYRKRLLELGATSPKTRLLDNGAWVAFAYFEAPDKPGELRRIETQGVSEADALLAILEQVQRNR